MKENIYFQPRTALETKTQLEKLNYTRCVPVMYDVSPHQTTSPLKPDPSATRPRWGSDWSNTMGEVSAFVVRPALFEASIVTMYCVDA